MRGGGYSNLIFLDQFMIFHDFWVGGGGGVPLENQKLHDIIYLQSLIMSYKFFVVLHLLLPLGIYDKL